MLGVSTTMKSQYLPNTAKDCQSQNGKRESVCSAGVLLQWSTSECDRVSCIVTALMIFTNSWHYTKWSRCSAACGGGVKTRTVRCMAVGMTARIVDTALCSHKKVPPSSKACNKKPCPYKWVHTDWSNVSALICDCKMYVCG